MSALLVIGFAATQARAAEGVSPRDSAEAKAETTVSAGATRSVVAPMPANPAARDAARQSARTGTPAPASSVDIARYSKREAMSPDAKKYQGGDSTIVIGATTLTIILAVVLLVVLL